MEDFHLFIQPCHCPNNFYILSELFKKWFYVLNIYASSVLLNFVISWIFKFKNIYYTSSYSTKWMLTDYNQIKFTQKWCRFNINVLETKYEDYPTGSPNKQKKTEKSIPDLWEGTKCSLSTLSYPNDWTVAH